jgi:hypothetical protein
VQDVQEQAEFVSNGAAEVDYVSLAERARERRRQLETRHTTVLEPPGYEGLLAVEYRELAQELGIELSDTLTARQAVFACFPRDIFVANHFAEYMSWLSEVESDIDVEQAADFPTTS